MRCLFSNLPAENLLLKDAKYTAMEIGAFSLHRPGRAWGLLCQLPHGVNKVSPLLCSLSYHIIPFIMLHLNRNEVSCGEQLSLVTHVPIFFLPLKEIGFKFTSEICCALPLPPYSQAHPHSRIPQILEEALNLPNIPPIVAIPSHG